MMTQEDDYNRWVEKDYERITGSKLDWEALVQAQQNISDKMIDEPGGSYLRMKGDSQSNYHVYDAHNQLWRWDASVEKWRLLGSGSSKTWVDLCMEQGPLTVYAKINSTRRGW